MIKIKKMGRKPLGKEKYQFTCPPELMVQFDELVAKQGLTRSEQIVAMIREKLAMPVASKRRPPKK